MKDIDSNLIFLATFSYGPFLEDYSVRVKFQSHDKVLLEICWMTRLYRLQQIGRVYSKMLPTDLSTASVQML